MEIGPACANNHCLRYFLITPKLLPDLFYNGRMRVLCIYNSEWLPEKIKPLQAYLDHAKATGMV